jgi:predicted metal-binding protein
MLTPIEDATVIAVCSTCRASADAREDQDGVRGGARLAALLRAVQAEDPRYAGLTIHAMPCLFACAEFCTVHLGAPGKIGYVMGRFVPDEDAARAILDYARAYADSAHGRVAFRDWPQGVKGHFLTRSPPTGFMVTGG